MDIALAVEKLLYAAQYSGSVTSNTEEAWRDIEWKDDRIEKPTWEELVAVYQQVVITNTIKMFSVELQNRLDRFANTRYYDNINIATTYANSTIESYSIEGKYAAEVRDRTWLWSNNYLNTVLPTLTSIPTWEEFEAKLDEAVPLIWPNEDIRDTNIYT